MNSHSGGEPKDLAVLYPPQDMTLRGQVIPFAFPSNGIDSGMLSDSSLLDLIQIDMMSH